MRALDKIDYYFKVVEAVALRGTCDRGRSGAIVVRDGRIVSTGYVGAPSGMAHCDDVGHRLETRMEADGSVPSTHCIRTSHAEINAIVSAARYGPPVDGATMYCTMVPCRTCAMAIVNAGIRKVVALYDYHGGTDARVIFYEAGVELLVCKNETMTYPQDR